MQAVACDMNSDFQKAFEEKCPHLEIVFDYFHVVKNFNDKVISEIRKDEQKRLLEEGKVKAANMLKGSKFILTSSQEGLRSKDKAAAEGKVFRKRASSSKSKRLPAKEAGRKGTMPCLRRTSFCSLQT